MIGIGSEFNRFGSRRVHIMLKRNENKMNHKRVYHLYKSANLELRKTV
ncbi:IS3 family transposase [Fusibacter sp. JL298sf-3]